MLTGFLRSLLLICIFCLSAALVAAQGTSWVKTAGPPGISVNVIYKSNDIVYAGTEKLGVYRSADNGLSWVAANNGIARTHVRDIIASGGNLLAATSASGCPGSNNVFKSTDNGATWTATSGLSNKVVNSFALKGGFVYAVFSNVTGSGVFRSADNGNTWQEVPSPIENGDKIFVSGNAIIVAEDNFIWRSVDDGAEWDVVEQFALTGIQSFARAGTRLFAASGTGMETSNNNGASWIFTPFTGGVASFAASGDTVFLGSANKVYRSIDFGASWQDVSTGLGKGSIQAMFYDGTDLFAATPADAAGIYHSTNAGTTWFAAAAGLPSGPTIRSMIAFGGSVFAGTQGDGIYRSNNHGDTWTKTDAGNALIAQGLVLSFCAKGNALFAGTADGIFKSTDGGATYQRVLNGFPANIRVQVYGLTVSSGNILAAVTVLITPTQKLDGIFYSSDDGANWHQANLPAGTVAVTDVASDGSPLAYAGVYTQSFATTGLYKSANGGVNWVSRTNVLGVDIENLAVRANNVLASTLFTAYYSLDFGELGWTPSSLPGSVPLGTGVDTYTLRGDSIYAGNEGMYVSTNSGANWTPIRAGFPTCPLPQVQASCADNNYLYAGTIDEGVWRKLIDAIPEPGRAAFDYDGDNRTDISVFRPSNGAWYLLQSTGGFFGTTFGLSTDRITPADFDGDQKTDIAVYRASSGDWFILKSSTGTITHFNFGIAEDLPTPADYDGDGTADIAVFRPSNGTWYRVNSSNGSLVTVQFGTSEDKPTIGDFDGDGKSDVAVFRPSGGTWYRLNSSNGSFFAEAFGLSTDLIAAADYDADGRTDIAVYRPAEGNWYLDRSTQGFTALHFGIASDIPAAGDFDGDGKADVSVFRPADGTWYRLNSANGAFNAVQFGTTGDRPTPSAFRY